ncbi:MAG: hypothetical protein L0Z71_07830, partial [Anaerolineae bacterium]|nr:hypothetical protein [Anaerolineae bacterium]
MPDQTTSSPNKRDNPAHWLEYLLFSEKIMIRWIRIACLLLVIIGWGIVGSLMFETDRGGLTYFNVARYALVPLAAILGALFLGARYLQDIYELPRFVSALRYLLGSMFDGPPYNIFLLSGRLLPSL